MENCYSVKWGYTEKIMKLFTEEEFQAYADKCANGKAYLIHQNGKPEGILIQPLTEKEPPVQKIKGEVIEQSTERELPIEAIMRDIYFSDEDSEICLFKNEELRKRLSGARHQEFLFK